MKIIAPFELTGAMLTSSTVPETDYAEWAAGTAYSVGQKVIRLTTHRAYEALTSSTGKVPEDSPRIGWTLAQRIVGECLTRRSARQPAQQPQ